MSRKIGAHVSVAGGIVNAIDNIKNINGNCLQIFAGSPRRWARKPYTKDQANNFNSPVIKFDLHPVFIHALYLVNLASNKKDLVKKSYQALLTDLKNGHAINSAGVIVHIGSHQGRGFDSVKKQLVNKISALINETRETPFIIENSAGQKGKIGSLEEIAYLVKKVNNPRFQICLDSAHLFAAGWDLRQKSKVDNLVSHLKQLSILNKVICLHLNDSKSDHNSHRDIHANLGKGKIGDSGLSHFINHPDLKDLPIILEVPGLKGKGPDKENITIAQKLANNYS